MSGNIRTLFSRLAADNRTFWVTLVAVLLLAVVILFAIPTDWPVRGSVQVTSEFSAIMQVPESDIALVHVNQPVNLHLLAYPGEAASAQVVSIEAQGQPDENGQVTFNVLLSITAAPNMTLRDGMTGQAEIVVARDALFYVWSGRASRAWLTWQQSR